MNKKVRFLVVDDSRNIRKVILNFLSKEFELEIFEAGNGEEAETIMQEQAVLNSPIDLVILDWMMPVMSGFQFLQKIRGTNSVTASTPIIMLTAETNADQIVAAQKWGVKAYIIKPFTKEQLVGCVKDVLKERRGTRAA